MPFEAGQEKKGGRKAGTQNKITVAVKELAQKYGEKSIDGLYKMATSPSVDDRARVQAYIHLLDRGYGKPKQEVGFTSDEMPDVYYCLVGSAGDAGKGGG